MSTPVRLGRYAVRRRIGAGTFATVWLCYDEQLDSPVAVKLLADNWAGDLHVRRRFLEEGRFLRMVESPHVVPVYDAGELADGRPFLVMGYADRGNLTDRLDFSRLSVGQAMRVVREVGDGLSALHQRGVLHRDIKPGNVLFRTSDSEHHHVRAMVGDLGLGKALDMSSRLTMVAGTPAYVAPEQARGERLDARADQFSLAALAYLLLAGHAPFAHSSLSAAADPPAAPELGDDLLTPGVVDATKPSTALRRGMAADPADRYDDIATFVDALQQAMTDAVGDAAVGDHGDQAWLPADSEETMVGAQPSIQSFSPASLLSSSRASSPASVPASSPTSVSASAPVPRPASVDQPSAVAPVGDGREVALSRRRRWPLALAGLLALVGGAAGGWLLERGTQAPVALGDDGGVLSVTVPAGWAQSRATGGWTPAGADDELPALSAGSVTGWQDDPDARGVFLGLLPGEGLPEALPGHPECRSAADPVEDRAADGLRSTTVVSSGCADDSVVVERVVLIDDDQLLWIQIKADDSAAATSVLDTVEVAGS